MDEAKTAPSYGATFRRLRMTFGVKQKELAAAGVSIQTVSRFEHNDTGLEIRHADTLLGFLPATLYEYVQSNIWLPLDGFDGFLNYLGVLMVQPNAESLLQNAALNARITYARCGEDKYLFRAVMFASAQNDELQRRKERTAVMRQLLAVRQWTNYEFVLFRRALRGTLQLDDARQLWSRLLGVGNKRRRLNQRRQLLQVDALLTVLSRSIAGQDFRLARRAWSPCRNWMISAEIRRICCGCVDWRRYLSCAIRTGTSRPESSCYGSSSMQPHSLATMAW